jgi:hypothetical protein
MVRTPDNAPLPPGGVDVDLASSLSTTETVQRVCSLVVDRVSLEVSEPPPAHRRLLGSVDGPAVHLVLRDDRIWTRRRSWNVEFVGEITPTQTGSALRGTIDVPDRQTLANLMWMFRLASIGIAVLIIAIKARTGFDPGTVAFGVVMVAFVWFVTMRMETDGLKYAAEDANLIERGLRTTLRP